VRSEADGGKEGAREGGLGRAPWSGQSASEGGGKTKAEGEGGTGRLRVFRGSES